MKRFGFLVMIAATLATQYGCGHRRACCRSCRPACCEAPSCCDSANGCAASDDGFDHGIEAPTPAPQAPTPVPEVATPTSALPPIPAPFAVPTLKRNEPTPADPKTAPKNDFDVAQKPDVLQLNQPTPPPDLY